jgi:ATP-dependent DNA helicase RecG
MTYQELLEIIANPENSKVEFKLDSERPERIAKEIVAFANFRGGRIFFGVDNNNREIKGLSKENFEEWLMDTVFGRYVTPSIIPLYEEINTPEGRVAVVTIEQGINKPYFVKEGDRETPYIRIGSTSQIADREQILRMAQESGYYHFEIAPVSGTSFQDIDKELFIHYYRNEFGEDLSGADEDLLIEKLNQLDLLVRNSFNEFSASIAGLVIFGKNPGRFLSNHGFRVIHYPGNDIETNHHFDQAYNLPLASVKNEKGEVIRSGLIETVMNKLGEIYAREELTDGIHRETVWIIPERALRELLVNAIIHRDYTKRNRNEIRIFNDRIEIESQGRLPNTLTIEKIKAGQKYQRNPILVRFAQDFGLMEHKGLGIRKIVIETLRNAGMKEALMEETEETFKLTIFRPLH